MSDLESKRDSETSDQTWGVRSEDLQLLGLSKMRDGSVTWSEQSTHHPRNWTTWIKALTAGLALFYEFFTTIIATTGPSAAHYAREQGQFLGSSNEVLLVCFASSYSLGQALGSMTVPPFSETAGRKSSYLFSCAGLSFTYFMTAVSINLPGIFIGRLCGGFASAVPSLVVGGTIEDLYDEQQRIWLVWCWTCITVLSQVLGPVYGSFVGHGEDWRWIYYIPTIVLVAMLPLFIISPETRPTVVLASLAGKAGEIVASEGSEGDRDISVSRILGRPLRLLLGEPLIIMVTIISAFAMGLIYLFTASLDVVYGTKGFDFSYTASSLGFLAMACGSFFSALPRLIDMRRYRTAGATSNPELKLTGLFLGSPALAIGLWIFAWTVPTTLNVHWIASMLGLACIGFAATEISYTLQGYIADSYTTYASSALSGSGMAKALTGAVAPLFAQQMYEDLGNNVASSILAAFATVFLIAPFVFVRYGPRMRGRSKFIEQTRDNTT